MVTNLILVQTVRCLTSNIKKHLCFHSANETLRRDLKNFYFPLGKLFILSSLVRFVHIWWSHLHFEELPNFVTHQFRRRSFLQSENKSRSEVRRIRYRHNSTDKIGNHKRRLTLSCDCRRKKKWKREKCAGRWTECVRACVWVSGCAWACRRKRGKCTFVMVALKSGTCMLAGYMVVRGKRALNPSQLFLTVLT